MNKKYKDKLGFWIEQFGEEFFDLLEEFQINLDDDTYHFLDISSQNKSIIRNFSLNDFKEILRTEKENLNFRKPCYFLNDILRSKQDDKTIEENKDELLESLKKCYDFSFKLEHFLEKYDSENQLYELNKLIEILRCIDEKLKNIENLVNNKQEIYNEKKEITIKEYFISLYNKYSFFILVISVLITILLIK